VRRIYEHAFDQGWLEAGDTVLDPFGGVSLGALEAMRRGLHWVGVELEPRFVGLGQQNIDLWNATYADALPTWGTAQILQGDSRELARVVGEAMAVVSSPPFASTDTKPTKLGGGRGTRATGESADRNKGDYHYPDSAGQLANLPEGDFCAAISSPPYADGCAHTGGDDTSPEHIKGGEYHGIGIAGAISSPPYAESMEKRGGIDPEKSDHISGPYSQMNRSDTRYGTAPGQLGAMPAGEFAAAVSSPPFEKSETGGAIPEDKYPQIGGRIFGYRSEHQGCSPGQLAEDSGPTFWTAARAIVAQTYHVLRPGAVAIWVTKSFVRNKKRVDFPGQWLQLCQSCGFEPLEWIRAWLVEDNGTQAAMFGEDKRLVKERKSFFRRLAESKGSPPIDYEVVVIVRKPNA